jgi:hypothetical protein
MIPALSLAFLQTAKPSPIISITGKDGSLTDRRLFVRIGQKD